MAKPKRIALFFDGTWNTPDDNSDDGDTSTNVCKLYEATLDGEQDGVEQVKWYDEGVGTQWYERIRGGVIGVGLSRNIQEGYRKLAELYEDGDQIFLFGFSRGGYTARSLVGLVRNAGLLPRERLDQVEAAYSLYRTRGDTADSATARHFRQEFGSRLIPFHFLGVWDTVGSLGIPLRSFRWFNHKYYEFHDTELSGSVKHAYHALAIDEHRPDYRATMWDPKEKPAQTIEQVWFAGAHADVGGGYSKRELANVTLRWMAEHAAERGLSVDMDQIPDVDETCYSAEPNDSFREFLKGIYSLVQDRYYRPLGTARHGAEVVHESVKERWNRIRRRPKNPVGQFLAGAPWED